MPSRPSSKQIRQGVWKQGWCLGEMGRCMVHLSPAVTVLDVVLTLCRTLKEVERKNTDCQHFFFFKSPWHSILHHQKMHLWWAEWIFLQVLLAVAASASSWALAFPLSGFLELLSQCEAKTVLKDVSELLLLSSICGRVKYNNINSNS